MYSVTVYKKTGFNSINIPDRPALLDLIPLAKRQEFPALDILQDGFLSSVSIRSTWDEIKHGDYCKIGDWYYFIAFVEMTSPDVAHLVLAADFITTAGGIRAITFLDGITQRAHTPSDGFGEWCEDDPFLTPSEPMIMRVETIKTVGDNYIVLGESSLDLGLIANAACVQEYVNGYTGADKVSYSHYRTYNVIDGCQYSIVGVDPSLSGTGHKTPNALFPLSDSSGLTNNVNRTGMETARGLGVPEPVVACAALPLDMITVQTATEEVTEVTQAATGHKQVAATYTDPDGATTIRYIDGELVKSFYGGVRSWSIVTKIIGKTARRVSSLYFYRNQNIKNCRILYGSQVPVGIVSSAGNRIELNPEQVTTTENAAISIIVIVDPHLDGCAYINFPTRTDIEGHNEGDSVPIKYLMSTAIKTLPWRQVPIAYTKPEGSILTRESFTNSQRVSDMQRNRSQKEQVENAITTIGGNISQGLQAAAMAEDKIGAGIAIGAGVATSVVNGIIAYDRFKDTAKIYSAERAAEYSTYLSNVNINKPNTQVSYDNNPIREYFGDLAIVYRYEFSDNDEARLDKVLTMYGYKCTIPVSQDLFFNREKFNYVQASVSVTGDFSKSIADGIALQLSGGVRVWHVLPDVNTYTTGNPIA